jgi:hypothetical protein
MNNIIISANFDAGNITVIDSSDPNINPDGSVQGSLRTNAAGMYGARLNKCV